MSIPEFRRNTRNRRAMLAIPSRLMIDAQLHPAEICEAIAAVYPYPAFRTIWYGFDTDCYEFYFSAESFPEVADGGQSTRVPVEHFPKLVALIESRRSNEVEISKQ